MSTEQTKNFNDRATADLGVIAKQWNANEKLQLLLGALVDLQAVNADKSVKAVMRQKVQQRTYDYDHQKEYKAPFIRAELSCVPRSCKQEAMIIDLTIDGKYNISYQGDLNTPAKKDLGSAGVVSEVYRWMADLNDRHGLDFLGASFQRRQDEVAAQRAAAARAENAARASRQSKPA